MGSVPDNVRDGGVKPSGRPVQQKINRLLSGNEQKVRVKRRGKSAPGSQQWESHGKPHTEQDQIGRDSFATIQANEMRAGPARPDGWSFGAG